MRLGIALSTAAPQASADTITTVAETAECLGVAGSASPGGIQRAVQLGLELNPVWFGWEALEGAVQSFRAAAAEAGRDPAALSVILRVDQFPAAEPDAEGASPVGSPEQIVEAVPRPERLGVTEALRNLDEAPGDEQLPRLARLAVLASGAA